MPLLLGARAPVVPDILSTVAGLRRRDCRQGLCFSSRGQIAPKAYSLSALFHCSAVMQIRLRPEIEPVWSSTRQINLGLGGFVSLGASAVADDEAWAASEGAL